MYLIDYHIHPNYSIDAEDHSVESYCRQALKVGLKEICFTTHFECDPVRAHMPWDGFVRNKGRVMGMTEPWLEDYLNEVFRNADFYKQYGLQVKAGLEVGYEKGLENSIARVLKYPFDFVIGSVHSVDHVALYSDLESDSYFPGEKLETVVQKYFASVMEAVKSGLFDVIGHLDLYRRHGTGFYGERVEEVHVGIIEGVLQEMADRGVGIEINTSSRKHGHAQFYPGRGILTLAKKAGIKVYTTGSDSHSVVELGTGIIEAANLLMEMDLPLCTFDKRKHSRIMLEQTGN